jgi:hypothetical protein
MPAELGGTALRLLRPDDVKTQETEKPQQIIEIITILKTDIDHHES